VSILKNHLHDHVVVLCANIDGKAFVAMGISDTVVAARKLDAAKIIKEHVCRLNKRRRWRTKVILQLLAGRISVTLMQ
jgi:hypothetical protein